MDAPRPSPGSRIWAYGISLGLIAAVLLPVLGDPRDDDFPLSTYPMFSGRASSEASISHAVGVLPDGSEVNLPPESFANDEVIQAHETARQAVAQGSAATLRLCEKAAAWAADNRPDITSVQFRTDRFDAVAYFDRDKTPLSSDVHASCPVER